MSCALQPVKSWSLVASVGLVGGFGVAVRGGEADLEQGGGQRVEGVGVAGEPASKRSAIFAVWPSSLWYTIRIRASIGEGVVIVRPAPQRVRRADSGCRPS